MTLVNSLKHKDNKALIEFDRATANILATATSHKTTFLMLLCIFFCISPLLAFCFFFHNYWIILFSIILVAIFTMVPYLKKFLIPIGLILCILSFLFHKVLWLLPIGISLLLLCVTYYIWWSTVCKYARNNLLSNQSWFEELWDAHKIALTVGEEFYIHPFSPTDISELEQSTN